MKNAEWQLADSYPISWNNPRFGTPFERRRLRILNSLFFAVAKMKGKPSVRGREELEIHISFFQQHFHFTLDQLKQLRSLRGVAERCAGIRRYETVLVDADVFGSEEVLANWEDDDAQKLEMRMTDIAAKMPRISINGALGGRQNSRRKSVSASLMRNEQRKNGRSESSKPE